MKKVKLLTEQQTKNKKQTNKLNKKKQTKNQNKEKVHIHPIK